jgi:hypothetical protein
MTCIPQFRSQVCEKLLYPGHGQLFSVCQNPGYLVFLLL